MTVAPVRIMRDCIVGVSVAIVVALLLWNLPGDLFGDLATDLPGYLDWHLHGDVLAALPGNLLWYLAALLYRNARALTLLGAAIAFALLLVQGLASLLIDRLIVGVALLLVLCLVAH